MTVDIPVLVVLVALLLAVTTVIVFAVVAVSIRSEDNRRRLDGTAPSHAEWMTRRLVGAYSRRHDDTAATRKKGGERP
ncbi:hypothetical protein [Nonomuraea endophytica]|uniref:CHASE1-domain containing sensor protein n=1 Tax=Nonomuraea endophytica TaxID=714136 RepID=A0A7W8ABC8_9ACTN|nr:hypothetical protein [Nonomuraea endophytica]MBB5082993.1 CHASE1-domain containing sensor protein [Nonomuraea endophytica]